MLCDVSLLGAPPAGLLEQHGWRPTLFQFVESYPLTASGKVQKFVLRERAIKTLGLEDVAKIRTA